MKPEMLCLLLLTGCLRTEGPRTVYEYALTWTCLSAEGCERTEELERIDRLLTEPRVYLFTSTQDESFSEGAQQIFSDLLPPRCSWMYDLSLVGHELEPSRLCYVPGGFELELSIPNEDPATQSQWLVEGRDLNF